MIVAYAVRIGRAVVRIARIAEYLNPLAGVWLASVRVELAGQIPGELRLRQVLLEQVDDLLDSEDGRR